MSDSLCCDIDPPGNVQRNEQNIKHEHHVTDIEQQLEKSYREREEDSTVKVLSQFRNIIQRSWRKLEG